MPTSIEPQDVAPLLPVNKESEMASELPPMLVTERTGFAARLSDSIYSRITHYWIAFIAQTCHLVLCAIGIRVVAAIEVKAGGSAVYDDDVMFFRTTLWSAMTYIILGLLIIFHYKKDIKSGQKRILAGHHVSSSKLCAIVNAVNCFFTALPYVTSQKELIFEDDIRPIIIPLMVGFLFVASGACFTAGRITYSSAVSARGMESVPDPEYRVPAWTLATTDESQVYRRSGGAVKLPV